MLVVVIGDPLKKGVKIKGIQKYIEHGGNKDIYMSLGFKNDSYVEMHTHNVHPVDVINIFLERDFTLAATLPMDGNKFMWNLTN